MPGRIETNAHAADAMSQEVAASSTEDTPGDSEHTTANNTQDQLTSGPGSQAALVVDAEPAVPGILSWAPFPMTSFIPPVWRPGVPPRSEWEQEQQRLLEEEWASSLQRVWNTNRDWQTLRNRLRRRGVVSLRARYSRLYPELDALPDDTWLERVATLLYGSPPRPNH